MWDAGDPVFDVPSKCAQAWIQGSLKPLTPSPCSIGIDFCHAKMLEIMDSCLFNSSNPAMTHI